MKKSRFLACFPPLLTLCLLGGCQKPAVPVESIIPPPPEEAPAPEQAEPATPDAGTDLVIDEEILQADEQAEAPLEVEEKNLETPAPAAIEEPRVAARTIVADLPDPQYIAARMAVYSEKLHRWQTVDAGLAGYDIAMPEPDRWRECYSLLGEIVAGYTELNTMLLDNVAMSEGGPTPLSISQRDIGYLESDCDVLFASTVAIVPDRLKKYRAMVADQGEAVVRHFSRQGEYENVVSAYRNLIVSSSGHPVPAGVRELYGRALLATGSFEQAARVLLEVAEEKGGLEGVANRVQAADLFFALGQFATAREQYLIAVDMLSDWQDIGAEVKMQLELLTAPEEQSRELELYGRILFAKLHFNGWELPAGMAENVRLLVEGHGDSLYAQMGQQILDGLAEEVNQRVRRQVEQARSLAGEKRYNEALGILEPLLGRNLPRDTREMVSLVEAEVQDLKAQEMELKKKLAAQALAAKWDEARLMFDRREYDQAIDGFTELLNTEYGEEAEAKMAQAVNLAAAELRKESAVLFVKSRKVQHQEQKGSLLLQSRQLLLTILKKYPEADVADKVRENLRVIEEQIRELNLPEEILREKGWEVEKANGE